VEFVARKSIKLKHSGEIAVPLYTHSSPLISYFLYISTIMNNTPVTTVRTFMVAIALEQWFTKWAVPPLGAAVGIPRGALRGKGAPEFGPS
jgi:hypothetical protein